MGGTSPDDVWAVGTYVDPSSGFQSLALHWDGVQWVHVPTPSPANGYLIKDVDAVTPDDVWAVGGHGLPYVFHFDGSTWSASLLPQPGQWGFGIAVSDVVALAANDVWAVGWYDHTGGAGLRTAIWHWNGANWSVVPSPNVLNPSGNPYPSMLLSISAASANAIFAVGEWRVGNTWFPLALRYDGTSWQLQNTPLSPAGDGRLRAVSARAADDVWAVGTADDHASVIEGGYAEAFAMHFDGSSWSVVPTPQPSPSGVNPLRSVVAVNGHVVAIGCFSNATQGLDTFILHMDEAAGGGFSIVPSTNIPGNGQGWNELFDIARFGDELWAVGYGQPAFSTPHLSLVERSPLDTTGTPYCFGDGTAGACPCGNSGLAGRGCNNSAGTGGAVLSASGTTSPDTVTLLSQNELSSVLSVFLQGDASSPSGIVFGDGMRCIAGNLKRLYTRTAVAGTASAPSGIEPSITTQSANLGDPLSPGSVRYYQVYYRDPSPSFCPDPPGNTWNISSGLEITW